MRIHPKLVIPIAIVAVAAWLGAQAPERPPRGQFGLALVSTTSGGSVSPSSLFMNKDCGLCHERQVAELTGSMHSAAHLDPFYRAFAELAREEAGDEVYAYCSGCHSPAGVVTGLIPDVHDPQLPEVAKAGVTCDVCHQISRLTGDDGPWGEQGNASFEMEPGNYRKFGPADDVMRNLFHKGVGKDFYTRSEYCAACHTVIHPINGLRIEHTYDEWKKSIYAEKGIQCQDCHMRSVEDAIRVATDLQPVAKPVEKWAVDGQPRPTSRHYFVGGNVDAAALGGGAEQAAMAEARLKSAATLAVETGSKAVAGQPFSFDVVVTNVGAGHSLPTSLTELREMWVHLRVTSAAGELLFESGHLHENGEIADGAIRFGAHTVDAAGEVTYKPWEAVGFGWKRLIPAKASVRDTVIFELPEGASCPLTVEARLLYRTAPPQVIREVMGTDAYTPKVVEMAAAKIDA